MVLLLNVGYVVLLQVIVYEIKYPQLMLLVQQEQVNEHVDY